MKSFLFSRIEKKQFLKLIWIRLNKYIKIRFLKIKYNNYNKKNYVRKICKFINR